MKRWPISQDYTTLYGHIMNSCKLCKIFGIEKNKRKIPLNIKHKFWTKNHENKKKIEQN